MSLTESDMATLREMFVDVASAMGKSISDQLGAQIAAAEKSLRGELVELTGKVGYVLDRLTVIESDVSHMRAQLAGLARVDVQRRLDQVEARLTRLEGARQ